MQILDRYFDITGIDINIVGFTNKVTARETLKRGFRDRLSFIKGDIHGMSYCDDFFQVDLLTCFIMGHDF